MENKFFEDLKEKVKKTVGEKGSHDFSHIERVYYISIKIAKGLDVDMDIVKAAALLHDISRINENKKNIRDHAAQGAIEAKKILKSMKFPEEKIDKVCKCILSHNKKEDLSGIKEARVLKEADGLETMGAIGIARSFSFLGEKYSWKSKDPLNPINELSKNTNISYFKIAGARKLAQEKAKFTINFCNQFNKEYNINN